MALPGRPQQEAGGRQILGGLVTLLLATVLLLVLLWVFQRRLIYLPLALPVPPAGTVLPGSEELVFRTEDGLELGGWFLPAGEGDARAAVLVFNGNAGHRAFRAPLAAALSRVGFSVLLFDYRGYGGNRGSPSEAGLAADARAAQAYLASRPDVDPGRMVYFGESLGAAVAVALAAERPPLALILRSPFTSLAEVGSLHYRYLPVRQLLLDRYPAIDQIARVSAPVLVVAGERDGIIPAAHSRRLFEAVPGRKRLALIPGVDHNDFELLAGEDLIRQVVGFVDETLAAGSGETKP